MAPSSSLIHAGRGRPNLPRRRFSLGRSSCFVGRDEKRAPLKTPAWEAKDDQVGRKNGILGVKEKHRAWFMTQRSHESKFELGIKLSETDWKWYLVLSTDNSVNRIKHLL